MIGLSSPVAPLKGPAPVVVRTIPGEYRFDTEGLFAKDEFRGMDYGPYVGQIRCISNSNEAVTMDLRWNQMDLEKAGEDGRTRWR